jgi:hypothetical protein
MASIGEVEFTIENQIIHLTLNIHVQQNISKYIESIIKSYRETHMSNEQLQLNVLDDFFLVGVIMLNVIYHRLKIIKHIQNQFFSDPDVIMLREFYNTPPIKDC